MNSNQMTPEALRQKAYELAASAAATPSELESIAEGLQQAEAAKQDDCANVFDRKQYEADAASNCFEKRAELPEPEGAREEVNPLDDDEKLRQVRIAVFGSAPE